MQQNNLFFTFFVFMALLSGPAFSQDEGQWNLSVGVDYSSGDYGERFDTDVTYIPVTARYTRGPWEYTASISHITVDGVGTVIPGEGVIRGRFGSGPGAPLIVPGSESGLGDVWLGASYFVNSIAQGEILLDLGARIKIPTADEDKGLGTGEADVTIQGDFYKPMGDMTPFLTLGYKFKGDSPAYPLDDVPFFSVGSNFNVSDISSVGLSMDWQDASYRTSSNYLELTGYYNRDLQNDVALLLYAYTGLEDTSPDFGIGVQLSFDL